MATVTGLTAARMQEIIDATIVDADIVAGHLILTKDDGSTYDAGAVGPAGKGSAFPAGATDGDLFVRTDQPLDPLYKYTDGAWTLFTGGGVGKGTAFPTVPAPTDGDMYVRTDQTGDPLYKYTDGVWELLPRMGSLTVPEVTVRRNSAQANGVSNDYAVSYDTVLKDTNGMWSASNPTRLTVKTPGRYRITATLGYSDYVPDWQALRLNGIPSSPGYLTIQPVNRSGGNVYQQPMTWEADLAAGDYIEHVVHNTPSGSIGLAAGSPYGQATMSMTWMGGPGQTVDERGVPACKAFHAGAALSVPTTTETLVPFDSEYYDTDGIHDTAANTTRFTCKTPGLYRFTAAFVWTSSSTGYREAYFKKNGGTALESAADDRNTVSTATWQQVSGEFMLAAGDYVELAVWHQAGAGPNIGSRSLSVSMVGSGKTVTPYSRVYKTAAQNVPGDGSFVAVSFDTEEADNDGIHDNVTNNTRLTCRTAGIYVIKARAVLGSSGGDRYFNILKNGTSIEIGLVPSAPGGWRQDIVSIVELAVGDYVELSVAQTTATTLALGTGTGSTTLSMVKVGAPITGNLGVDPVEAKQTPTFINGWNNYGIGSGDLVKFYKDRGRVYLSGMLVGGAAGSNAFVLPVGYRPPANKRFACPARNQTAGAYLPAYVHVNATGEVAPTAASLTTQGVDATTWVDLSGISFDL